MQPLGIPPRAVPAVFAQVFHYEAHVLQMSKAPSGAEGVSIARSTVAFPPCPLARVPVASNETRLCAMNAKIVMVDDDEHLRFVVRAVLEADGCAVREAADCNALRRLLPGTAPDAVILDLNLPDGNGLELLPEVKRHWPKSKVIILTGFGTVQAAEAAYKVDDVYLQSKPFDAEMLKAMVALALAPKPPVQGSGAQQNGSLVQGV